MSNSTQPDERRRRLTGERSAAIVLAVVYGLIGRFVFGAEQFSGFLGTLSIGFLGVMPIAIGAITVYFGVRSQRSAISPFFDPWLPSLIFMVVVAFFAIELAICIVMAAPIFVLMSSVGGMITYYVLRFFHRRKRIGSSVVLVLLIAPYIFTPLEQSAPQVEWVRAVSDVVEVNADAATIWANITSVAPISGDEQRLSLAQIIGIPRPVEATLDGTGVGAVRRGFFDYGLRFEEVITVWQPGELLRFTVDAQPTDSTQQPFNMIGGDYFGLLDVEYRIETLPDGRSRLHLTTRYRLATRINAYGSLWIDTILHDFQWSILTVVKTRSERAAL